MKILIVYRITTYQHEKVHGLPRSFKPAFDSILNLDKKKEWEVDILMLNHYAYPPDAPLKFSWIYESMPSFFNVLLNFVWYKYILVVEPDIILPNDALIKLIETNADIVSAIYPERPSKVKNFPRGNQPSNGWLVSMPWNANPHAEISIAQRIPFKITGCAGFGCVLLTDRAMSLVVPFPSRDKNGKGSNGPDFAFYEKARNQNLNIICNPNIRCKHIEDDGTIIEGPE